MRSLTLPLITAAAALAFGAPAFAASSTMSKSAATNEMSSGTTAKHVASNAASTHVTTGKIKSIDTADNMLTLTNGKMFKLPADFRSTSLKAGEHVKVSYHTSGKTMSATSVVAAK